MRHKNTRVENVNDNVLELRKCPIRAPTSKTQVMCAVRPKRGGNAGTRPNVGDCYASVIISEFSSQHPMRLTHRTQIKRVADITPPSPTAKP